MVHLDFIVTSSGKLSKECFIESVSARKWTKCFANFHKNVCWTRIEKNWRNLFWKQKIFFLLVSDHFSVLAYWSKKEAEREKNIEGQIFFESTANSGQSMSTDKFFSKWCNFTSPWDRSAFRFEEEKTLDSLFCPITLKFVKLKNKSTVWEREREGEKEQEETDADWKYDRGSEKDGDGL